MTAMFERESANCVVLAGRPTGSIDQNGFIDMRVSTMPDLSARRDVVERHTTPSRSLVVSCKVTRCRGLRPVPRTSTGWSINTCPGVITSLTAAVCEVPELEITDPAARTATKLTDSRSFDTSARVALKCVS